MFLSLDAHAADVNGLAFRPDGGMLATAGDDREVRLWTVPSGRLSGLLRHPERVYGVAFSPDGKQLATGCDDGRVRLWSVGSHGSPTQTLTGHTSFVRHVAFSPDGRTLVSASGDRQVHLWALPEGRRGKPLVGHAHTVWGVAFSPDGQLVATASQDKTARVWQVSTGQLLLTLEGHDEIVWAVTFSPDGRLVATASHDRTARLWSAADGRELAVLGGHAGLVRALAFSPDGRTLATASGDGTVRLWLIHDDAERCDWSAGEPGLPPRPRVSVTRAGHGIVYPGDELWLEVAVENAGRGDLVQLRAGVESEAPLLRGLHALFGRVRPGEKVSRCAAVLLPPDQPPGELRGELVFHETNDYQPPPVPVVFDVRPLPRDDFHVRWRLVDDGSGNSFGDGDGRPQRGECLDVVATVENQTGEELEGLGLVLEVVDVPAGVVVNVPRAELPPLGDGCRIEGRVTFSVKPAAQTGQARFELRVESPDGRLFARVPVETEIE
jgi:Tol biopolymer transport system component